MNRAFALALLVGMLGSLGCCGYHMYTCDCEKPICGPCCPRDICTSCNHPVYGTGHAIKTIGGDHATVIHMTQPVSSMPGQPVQVVSVQSEPVIMAQPVSEAASTQAPMQP
jgi:hypothetical protein